jgi:ribosomal protein L35AE/L33A
MPSATEVRFRATTAPGTATSAKDFAAKEQTVSIAAGKVEAFFVVPLERDSEVEGAETFIVNISDAVGATLATRVVTGRIIDVTSGDPNVRNVTVSDVQVTEGNAGVTVARFTVSLASAAATVVNVAWGTADGSATAGSDYVAASGTLTFAPGETRKVIDVSVKGDTEHELDETFSVALNNGNGGTCRIINDDAPAPRHRSVRH